MSWLLWAARVHIPEFVRRQSLQELLALTAEAFGCKAPQTEMLSCAQLLHEYALFSRDCAVERIQRGCDLATVKGRLYRSAYRLGQRLRAAFGVATTQDVMTAGRLLYRALGIDFLGTAEGTVIISKCFFSRYYSSPVCEIISALDEGVLAGLSGGGRLSFCQRITAGHSCCRARFAAREGTP